jgi:hypothetical protein
MLPHELQAAINAFANWSSADTWTNNSAVTFSESQSGSVPITVTTCNTPECLQGAPAETAISVNAAGTVTRADITVDTTQVTNGTDFLRALMHEIGHTMGLDERQGENAPNCGYTVGGSVMNGVCGGSFDFISETVTDCDNGAVDSNPVYPPPPPPVCEPTGLPQCSNWDYFTCSCLDPPAPCEFFVPFPFCYNWDSDNCLCLDEGSPIVLRVDAGSAYRLTSRTEGVWFDLDADGIRDRIAWTRYGDAVAFLALDLNGNGLIDNGAELFGNFTVLPSGQPAPNGFEALAIYDAPGHGGNGDGRIDSGDLVWASLLLWIDWNHDGVSQQNELYRPQDFSLWEVSLDAQRVGRRDAFGNFFRLKAPYRIGSQVKFAYDVYFSAALSGRR